MNIYVNWTLVISSIIAVIGFWAYVLEMLQGRINRVTTWRELNRYQAELAVMIIGGSAVFLSTLIISAIIKSYT